MKKRLVSILLCGVLACGMLACGNKGNAIAGDNNGVAEESQVSIGSAVEALAEIWDAYDYEKFPVMGGDYENMVDAAPGPICVVDNPDTADTDESAAAQFMLLVPQDKIAIIDDGASMVHAMNQNTFTAGVFHLKNVEDAQTFADSYVMAVQGNMWVCGFPDRVSVTALGNGYVLTMFGENQLMTEMESTAKKVYPSAKELAGGKIE